MIDSPSHIRDYVNQASDFNEDKNLGRELMTLFFNNPQNAQVSRSNTSPYQVRIPLFSVVIFISEY